MIKRLSIRIINKSNAKEEDRSLLEGERRGGSGSSRLIEVDESPWNGTDRRLIGRGINKSFHWLHTFILKEIDDSDWSIPIL